MKPEAIAASAGVDGGQPAQVDQQAVEARDDAAADEGRDQRDEDVGDRAQEQLERGGVLRLLRRLDRRALRRQFVRRDGSRGGAVSGGPSSHQRLELRRDPRDRARAQHDLVRVVLDHAHHGGQRLERLLVDEGPVVQAQAEPGHAVGDGADVRGAADQGEDRGGGGAVLVFCGHGARCLAVRGVGGPGGSGGAYGREGGAQVAVALRQQAGGGGAVDPGRGWRGSRSSPRRRWRRGRPRSPRRTRRWRGRRCGGSGRAASRWRRGRRPSGSRTSCRAGSS